MMSAPNTYSTNKTMRVFLDTNIILDAIIPEREHRKEAMQVLSMAKDSQVKLCISSLTIANCAYILRKFCNRESTRTILQKICELCKVLPVNDTQTHLALKNDSPDYEDAIQMSCADLEGCDCIITHDSKHFRTYCQLPAYTAAEFIEGCRRRGRESRL